MNWSNLHDFLAMGGYALYVWGAFGMTVLAIGVEVAHVRGARRNLRSRGTR